VREQRRTTRFDLRLPLELIHAANQALHLSGETKNVSSRGVLFATKTPIPVGQSVEYFLTLPSAASGKEIVRVHCRGHVVRLEKSPDDGGGECPVLLAATLERYEFQRERA
jgi:hypothetical protein